MTDWPWPSMLIVSGAYLAMFAAGELMHQRRLADAEATRKLSHVAAGGIALTLPAIFLIRRRRLARSFIRQRIDSWY